MADETDLLDFEDGPNLDLVADDTDPAALEEQIYESIQSRWEEWEPADGNLEVWQAKAIALMASDLFDLAGQTADQMLADYGVARGIDRFTAAAAVGETTWTAIDDAGYTIDAGIELAVARSGNDLVAFQTVEETTIPQGDTTATVHIAASEPGADANGLTGPVTLTDALIWVDSITLNDPTEGGVDEEELTAYVPRLAERLRTASETLILPVDFEIAARTFFPYVARAVARDGWNPNNSTDDNPRMISVALIGHDGEPLSGPQKSEVEAFYLARREVNFEAYVIDADYTEIDVEYEIQPMPSFEMQTVRDAVDDALTNYLTPIQWGRVQVTGGPARYRLEDTVRYFEIISLIDRVPGVDYVVSLEIGEHGQALATSDIALAGAVPLTRPGDFTEGGGS